MKKIPTLFERVFDNHEVVGITDKVKDGMEWVLNGEGVATVKYDGACCAVINGVFYKRYDAKHGKKAPDGAIPCCDPDPITGHHPHWLRVNATDPADRWFTEAYKMTLMRELKPRLQDGTYEAVGKHFNSNPYGLDIDYLIKHGESIIPDEELERSFNGIKKYLQEHYIEGIVFWKDGEPQCKIKRTDFGFEWNGKGERQ